MRSLAVFTDASTLALVQFIVQFIRFLKSVDARMGFDGKCITAVHQAVFSQFTVEVFFQAPDRAKQTKKGEPPLKEEEIRKREAYDRYIFLIEKDAEVFFADKSNFEAPNCVACDESAVSHDFTKTGFDYRSCPKCSTLFVSPRPPFDELMRFYKESESSIYWIEGFFKPVADARREKIFRPRAERIAKEFNRAKKMTVGDIGAGFGLFLKELEKIRPADRVIAIEPSPGQAEICRGRGLETLDMALESIQGFDEEFDLLTSFELFEHLHDPREFLRHVRRLLKPGGFFFFTTLNGLGFDILTLWDKAKCILPPLHLNFFNLKSIGLLLESEGLEVAEAATPGKLDWDIVEGMIRNEGTDIGRFWRHLAFNVDVDCKKDFQHWISSNKLSSHMQVLSRKKPRIG